MALEAALAGLATGVVGWFAIWTTAGHSRVTAIWPANAVILAAVLRHPSRRWPAFLAAGALADVTLACLVGDRPPAVAVGISLSNLVAIGICAGGLRLIVGDRLDLSKPRHLAAFAALALLGSALAGAFAVSLLAPRPSYWPAFVEWTSADVLGLVIVTPALLALDARAMAGFLARGVAGRNLALLGLLAAVTVFVYSQPQLHFRYFVLGALVLFAFQAEVAGAAIGVLVVGALMVLLPETGLAPPLGASEEVYEAAFRMQMLLMTSALVAFPVAGAVARRRELAAALETTAHDFQLLADHSTDIIVRVDRDFRMVYVSPSCRQLGYEPADLIRRDVGTFMPPDNAIRMRAAYAALMAADGLELNGVFEQCLITANGETIWVEGSPQLLRDETGAPSGIVTQLRDITERKRAEAALAESEARYRLLADRATDIILQTDSDGIVRYISPACRRLGYEPEEMVGRCALDFVHEDTRELTSRRLRKLFEGEPQGENERREYRVVPKGGGDDIWLEGASSLIRDQAGRVISAVSLLRDVTERRAFEAELERKRAEAEAATVAKSEFLANMSHEIRTPLTGIMGFAGLLEAEETLTGSAKVFAQRIATASRALLTVVNDILDFSKIEAGQVELDPQPFDPRAFIAETVELVAAQAKEKKLRLETRVEGRLPAAVSADGGRLRQVLLNLLTNAVKFTERGEITVTLSHAAGQLTVSVADTGIGIAAGQLDRLFQRFSQADGSINRQYGGTGLGLAICKSLTQVMGGDIVVESRPGEGSRFCFTIAAPVATLSAAKPDADEPETASVRPANILVVDDSPVNRELVGVLLSVFGHDLTEAGGGAEAVALAGAEAFDLILMDLQMPGMDGLAATREIRRACPLNAETPIVALSANILPMHLEACREAGMDDHIAKPIDTRELLTKVARWTSREPAPALAEAAQA